MDILLNPNIAYLFLVAGFMLGILAIITPGTGILEIGTLFAVILAGWAVYSLPINIWALLVLLLGVFPFIIAVRRSQQMNYLVLSALALVLGSAFLFRSDTWWRPAVNPFLALVTSVLTGGYFWLAVRKVLEAEQTTPAHDLTGLIGSEGEASTQIHEEGSVYVNREMWTARSTVPISEGSRVRVIRREGLILEVELIGD